jgi:predicted RND superfamily exporter protein
MARLRFDAEVLDLFPAEVPAVEGLKLYQQHFINARELIITVYAPKSEITEATAQTVAQRLRLETNLVSNVTWQPPWLEHPEQIAELIAHLWLNQPPEVFGQLANRLAEANLPAALTSTRDQLATTLSPADIAQLSYDPFGLTRLPESTIGAAPQFGKGHELFASADGKFRVLFVKARYEFGNYRGCTRWFDAVKRAVTTVLQGADPTSHGVSIGYTGQPAFVAEISASMRHDMVLSIGGTSLIIAVLFWLAHRRWKPM